VIIPLALYLVGAIPVRDRPVSTAVVVGLARAMAREPTVPRTATVLTMKTALQRERRTNRRLRAVIDSMRDEIRETRHRGDVNLIRLEQV
jgi:hypothetical protein